MTTTAQVLPEEVLAALRTIGDPGLDDVVSTQPADAAPSATLWTEAVRSSSNVQALLGDTIARPEIDEAKLTEAQRLFATYGTEIAAALLLAILPQSYASA